MTNKLQLILPRLNQYNWKKSFGHWVQKKTKWLSGSLCPLSLIKIKPLHLLNIAEITSTEALSKPASPMPPYDAEITDEVHLPVEKVTAKGCFVFFKVSL